MPEDSGEIRAAVIAASRAKYARPRAEVEALLVAAIPGAAKPSESGSPAAASSAKTEPRREPAGVLQSHSTGAPAAAPPAPPAVPHIAEVPHAAEVPGPAEKAARPVKRATAEREHTGLKEEIGTEAESLDFTVSYEELFPAVQGRADVVLRRGHLTVVCQVSVTNGVPYEAASVEKFLKGGFSHIAVVSSHRRKLNLIQQALAATIPAGQKTKVGFYVPAEFISKLYEWAADDPEGGSAERGKPRKRKDMLKYVQLSESERRQRQADMLATLRNAMKR